MPTFDTPGPVSATVEIGVGAVRIVASQRADTVVDIRPTSPERKRDVTAAENTRVEFDGERLLVRGPRGWRPHSWIGGWESIDVDIALPAGSQLRCEVGAGSVHTSGRLGECQAKTGAGEVRIGEAGPLQVHTGAGDVEIERAVNHADVRTGAGSVRITAVAGTAAVKCSFGDTWIGSVKGDVRVQGSHGRVTVERADATVVARTSSGDIRLDDIASGTADAQTSYGSVEIGIREGVPAWLDLDTSYGTVANRLEESARPASGERAVEVRARTSYGRITVRRAFEPATAPS